MKMMDDPESIARELARQCVTAAVAYKSGDEGRIHRVWEICQEAEHQELSQDLNHALCDFVATFVMMNADLRGDCTGPEYWRSICLAFEKAAGE